MLHALLVAAAVAASPTPSPPPQIYYVVSRPLCSELHAHVKPALGMMMENDDQIKRSPDLFGQYNAGRLRGSDVSSANGDPGGDPGSNAPQSMALLGIENLIRPIANNIIAIQTELDSPALSHPSGRPEDDKMLQEIRERLLKALAAQNASLDIISGFYDTQTMADLQHAGQGYIAQAGQPNGGEGAPATPVALNPLAQNPNYAGLTPNPYTIDLATIPGLTLGYNPVTRLIEGLHWTMAQTETRENEAASAVLAAASMCQNIPLASPPPP